MLIDGKLVGGSSRLPVVNPATEQVFVSVPRASKLELDQAVGAAAAAFPDWAAKGFNERGEALVKIADILLENSDELSRLITLEQGKSLKAAVGEVKGASAFFRGFSEYSLDPRVIEDGSRRRVMAHRGPLGVVAAIVPWNFPIMSLGFKLPPALLAGNTIVLKTAPTTPVSTLRLGELVADVLPAGVLNIVVDNNDLGGFLTSHPCVRKVSFTGSTATGRKVMSSAADTLKRLTLELGGNDPAIVLDDADPKAICKGLFLGAFGNSGQICLAIKRVYVPDALYDDVCEGLAAMADASIVGPAADEAAQFGPVQNEMQYERVLELIRDARANGATAISGGIVDGPGYFIRPVILRDVDDTARVVAEEQFGPVLPVLRYSDLDDAIARANDGEFGLGASVWSSDVKRAETVAQRLEAGTVWINKHADIAVNIPLGGAKQSGFGLEFGEEGLAEFTQLKIINGPAGTQKS